MIYFDTVVNLMHNIWKRLAALPIRALFTRSNEIRGYNSRGAAKGNYLRRGVVKLENINALFRELEQYYGIEFLQTAEVYKPTLRKQIRGLLYGTLSDRDDYVEDDFLTQILVFSA